jgi:hypothetical protein
VQDTLFKVAVTLGILAILVAIVGFAVMPKDSPSLRIVRGLSVALIVLAVVAGAGIGLVEVWR